MKKKQIYYSLGKLETDFQAHRNIPLAFLQTFKYFIIIMPFFQIPEILSRTTCLAQASPLLELFHENTDPTLIPRHGAAL